MPEPASITIGDIHVILSRRKWSFILPAIAIFALSVAIAFLLTPIYESTSTILIEEQEIPRDFVISAVTSFAEQRIQSINQRIMSTTKLLEIINRFNLYAALRKKRTTEEIVDRMRKKDIKFQTISAEIIDRRTGNPTKATIAFSLSFKGESPALVQQVANVLASLYLEENLRAREYQAVGASKFLEDEMKGVKAHLLEIEARITPFKTKYIHELPELLQSNMQALDNCERDIDRARSDLRTAREREDYLRTQLDYLKTLPKKPTEPNPDKLLLKELKARLVQLQSKFSDQYPDVIKTKIEIAELEERLDNEEEEDPKSSPDSPEAENPAIVTLASQLAGTQSEIESLKRDLERVAEKKEMYRRRIEATPGVEEEHKRLIMERSNTQAKYDDLMKKFMEAKVSQGLEKEQMGERFTLIDPARFPEQPVFPNIPAILLIGAVLGIGAGIGTVSLREYSDHSVRTMEELAAAAQIPVLAEIPVIVTRREKRWQTRKKWLTIAAIVVILIAGPILFHYLFMDLEIFWGKLIRRLT
jgi:polysaccharide chain length determinant protein (PEP-CTERM system associated)